MVCVAWRSGHDPSAARPGAPKNGAKEKAGSFRSGRQQKVLRSLNLKLISKLTKSLEPARCRRYEEEELC